MQEFGSVWTEAKLNAVEQYLAFYTTALKKKGFKLCYIDAFAGSGRIKIKGGEEIDGSAIRALKYPFDKFYFFEEDQSIIQSLKHTIKMLPEQKDVEFYNADCNNFLLGIDKRKWKKEGWRGVIFLDPYAMDLEWACLKTISGTGVFDVWYLFPFMAVNRNLNKNGKIRQANKDIINRILGTGWEQIIYSKSPQMSFIEENILQKISVDAIKSYILNRLEQIFPTVSKNARLLLNDRNSPQFLLCFAGSNPSPQSKVLSLRAADHILLHM